MTERTNEAAVITAVEALANRWADVVAECKQADPRWILDRSVTTLSTALDELRAVLAHPNPEPPTGDGGREGVGRTHEPTCAYYGLPFKAGSGNRICPCPGRAANQESGA